MTAQVQRDAARFVTIGAGWVGRSCFSYGEHYDAANVSFGRMLACNEFVLEPGSGFGRHRHGGVEIVTTVLSGVLTHLDAGASQRRARGSWLTSAVQGLEHDERNDGTEPVRFVQAFLLPGDRDPRPEEVTGTSGLAAMTHALVVEGAFVVRDAELGPGDSARLEEAEVVAGSGLLLAWDCG